MPSSARRTLAVAVAAVVLGVVAAPAQATLLVRSDGAGLFIQDKNNLDDFVKIATSTDPSSPGAYTIHNDNAFDAFKFDRGIGCSGSGDTVTCARNGPQVNILLVGGNDILSMRTTNGIDGPVISQMPVGESHVSGGSGNDTLNGHAGVDHLNGGTGSDKLRGSLGNDELDGRDDSDRLEGGDGNDNMAADDGADVLDGGRGADFMQGGQGFDFLNSREPEGTTAVADTLDCGTGQDTVEADLKDLIQPDCNSVDRAPVGETPNVNISARTLRVSRDGRVRVRLRCPRGVKKLGCKGTLQLRLDTRSARRSRSRKVRYRIKAGRRKAVTVRLSAGDVRKLRRNKRRGRKTRGILTSVEKGRKGRKTTIRNPRLKLR